MIQNCGPIPRVTQNPNYDSQLICTLNCHLLVTLQLSAVFHDVWHWSWVWAPLPWSLPFCPLSLIPQLVAPSPFMRVAEPSCCCRCLKCSGWALFSAASSTISLWLSSLFRREMRYGVVPLSHRQNCISSKNCPSSTKNSSFSCSCGALLQQGVLLKQTHETLSDIGIIYDKSSNKVGISLQTLQFPNGSRRSNIDNHLKF